MEQKVLNARTRTETGKGAAKRLRAAGRLPAVMYNGEGKAIMIDIDEKEFSKLFHLITESTLIDVKLDGAKGISSFVKDVQYDIIIDKVNHIDFYEVDANKMLRTKIMIKLSGSPDGVRQGGVLEAGTTAVEVECLPKDLPERIIVDVSDLQLNHSIHVKDLKVASTVKILSDPHKTVATLKYIKNEVPAAEETAEAAPAAG
ncbi:MAG TPA: 50S ribosomal protein L25, partial [Treponemataceae bacterium]|nr:50S ribosomal protein L25 [Treponemataceae bacterium]